MCLIHDDGEPAQEETCQSRQPPQDSHAILVVIMIGAALCVIYWRLAIRLFVIMMVALALYGAIVTLHL